MDIPDDYYAPILKHPEEMADEYSKTWNLEECARKSFLAGFEARQPEIESLHHRIDYWENLYYQELNRDKNLNDNQ